VAADEASTSGQGDRLAEIKLRLAEAARSRHGPRDGIVAVKVLCLSICDGAPSWFGWLPWGADTRVL
jgi:hypothetical protein